MYWITNYRQVCALRYVEGFTTKLDRNTLNEKLKTLPEVTNLLRAKPLEPDFLYNSYKCRLSEADDNYLDTPIMMRPKILLIKNLMNVISLIRFGQISPLALTKLNTSKCIAPLTLKQ